MRVRFMLRVVVAGLLMLGTVAVFRLCADIVTAPGTVAASAAR